MTLKLLSQKDANSQAKRSLESEKYRLVEVQTLITDKYKELSQAERDFADVLEKQQGVWSKELADFETKRNILKKEVEELEQSKAQALIPLTEREKMLDTKASALATREQKVAQKEADLEEKSTLLTVKLDEVADRELQADKLAKTLTQREEGVRLQAGSVTRDQALLATASTELTKRINEAEHNITLKWAAVNAKEANLLTRERKVDEAEAGFAARERAIQDKYATLERAIKQHDDKQSTTRDSV